tara:strand:- start:1 stop:618 length:618 start_codon:yes stop_codon:yes gene_type:complete
MFDFKMNNLYYYLFLIFGFISILIVLYFWRKIINLTNSNDILDKKCTLLKKENKVLKEDFISKKIPEDSNVVMNEIFNVNDLDESIEIEVDNVNTPDTYVKEPELENNEPIVVDLSNDITDIVDEIIKPNNDSDIKDIIDLSDIKSEKNDDSSSTVSEIRVGTYSRSKLNKLSVDKLREICINNNGSDEGTKQVLIERILKEEYK